MRTTAFVILAACGNGSSPTPAPTGSGSAKPAPAIDAKAIDAIATKAAADVPGLAIAVRSHGQMVIAKGYGVADLDAKTPVTADTVFRIGSITKQFTAAAVLQLAAKHELSVDDKLVKYLPDYPVGAHDVTLRELLTHTSGIADYEHAPWLEAHESEQHPPADLVASFAAQPFDFEPGTRWSYSNSGYFLLGEIVEQLAKQPFGEYVREHELAPAGVTGVRYCPDEQSYPNAAHGYTDGKPSRPILMQYAFTAGALCSTAPGLVAWTLALAHGKVVDDASYRAMTTPVALADGGHYNYGFGLFTGTLGGHRSVFHNGGINGFTADLAYYPDDELAIAVLMNSESGPADDLAEDIARSVLGVPRPRVEDLPIPAADAAAVTGNYNVLVMKAVVAIESDGGKLYLHPQGSDAKVRLLRQADGSYVLDGTHTQITFGPDKVLQLTQAGMTFEGRR